MILIVFGVDWRGEDVFAEDGHRVRVLDHGYHSGFLFERATLERFGGEISQLWLTDFPRAEWVEIGWGDKGFYFGVATLDDLSWDVGAKAVLWPTPTVMHVATGAGQIEHVFGLSDWVELRLTDDAMARLVLAVEDGQIPGAAIGPGLYAVSRFYEGRGSYFAFQTCNSWVAQRLRTAGVAASPLFALLSPTLLAEMRLRHGRKAGVSAVGQ